MRLAKLFLVCAAVLLLVSGCTGESGSAAEDMEGIHLDLIDLPEGFSIELITDQVKGARSLALSPNGVLYVGTRGAGNVYAISELDSSRPEVTTVASELNVPNGVAWRNGSLYVAEISRILRFDDVDARLQNPPEPVVVRSDYPEFELHGWKFIRFSPDGMLYVPVGAPCNICEPESPLHGSITRLDLTTQERDVYVEGVRNTVGFDFHPVTGELWFTDNGRDLMGDDLPPDELNRVTEEGQHFGFPYCHGGDVPDPEFGNETSCDQTVPPVVQLEPHVAALGMRFYTGDMFPSSYRHQVFIAEHGSWNRSTPIGYRVTLAKIGEGTPSYTVFAEGWLQGDAAWGRPVDVEVASDGSLFVSDDSAGAVYRIYYTGP